MSSKILLLLDSSCGRGNSSIRLPRVKNKLTTIKYRHVVIIVIIQDLTSPTLKTLNILYLPPSLPDSLYHSLPPLTHLIIGFSETTMPAPLLINWSSCILNFCFKIYNLKATK